MPIKDIKHGTNVKLTPLHKSHLLEHRNHIIWSMYYDKNYTKAEISFIFNLRLQNINKIIVNNKEHDKRKKRN